IDAEEDAYRTNLWLARVPAPGQEAEAPRALTFGGRDSQPRWSPDGRTLAFVRSSAEKKPGQLHVLSLEGGEARALTKLEKGASSRVWSPDSRHIAFLSAQNPALDAVEGQEKKKPRNEPARIVTKPEFRWNELGFYDFDHLDHVWVIDAGGGEPRQLT